MTCRNGGGCVFVITLQYQSPEHGYTDEKLGERWLPGSDTTMLCVLLLSSCECCQQFDLHDGSTGGVASTPDTDVGDGKDFAA